MIIQTWSEVKVTVTWKWLVTLPISKCNTHQIWNFCPKEYKKFAPDTIFLKTRSEVNVTVTPNGI